MTHTPRMAKMKENDVPSRRRQYCGATRTHKHCSRDSKLIQPLWENSGSVSYTVKDTINTQRSNPTALCRSKDIKAFCSPKDLLRYRFSPFYSQKKNGKQPRYLSLEE